MNAASETKAMRDRIPLLDKIMATERAMHNAGWTETAAVLRDCHAVIGAQQHEWDRLMSDVRSGRSPSLSPDAAAIDRALAAYYPGQGIDPENRERLRQRMADAIKAAGA